MDESSDNEEECEEEDDKKIEIVGDNENSKKAEVERGAEVKADYDNNDVKLEKTASKNSTAMSNKSTTKSNKITNEDAEISETKSVICSVCNEEFETRNKLFEHIKSEGHAAVKTAEGNFSHNALKKSRRALKTTKNKIN